MNTYIERVINKHSIVDKRVGRIYRSDMKQIQYLLSTSCPKHHVRYDVPDTRQSYRWHPAVE